MSDESHYAYMRAQDEARAQARAALDATMTEADAYAQGFETGYTDGREGYTAGLGNPSLGDSFPHSATWARGYREGWVVADQGKHERGE